MLCKKGFPERLQDNSDDSDDDNVLTLLSSNCVLDIVPSAIWTMSRCYILLTNSLLPHFSSGSYPELSKIQAWGECCNSLYLKMALTFGLTGSECLDFSLWPFPECTPSLSSLRPLPVTVCLSFPAGITLLTSARNTLGQRIERISQDRQQMRQEEKEERERSKMDSRH